MLTSYMSIERGGYDALERHRITRYVVGNTIGSLLLSADGAIRLLQNVPQCPEVGPDRFEIDLELLVTASRQLQQGEENFAPGAIGYDAHRVVKRPGRQLYIVIQNAIGICGCKAEPGCTECCLCDPDIIAPLNGLYESRRP